MALNKPIGITCHITSAWLIGEMAIEKLKGKDKSSQIDFNKGRRH